MHARYFFAAATLLVWLGVAGACELGPTFPSSRSWVCGPTAATANETIEMFRSPFDGTFLVGNFFDHDKPLYDSDPDARIVTLCGSSGRGQVNGHDGYDFAMPEGTPLRAVADGTVLFAGEQQPLYCAPLKRDVQAILVEVVHTGPDARQYVSVYGHLSRVDVTQGQSIRDGDQLGLSGNTGCSGSPHLHFSVFRQTPGGSYVVIDPFGWHGTVADPWETDPRGAKSAWLWRPGQAPKLDR